MLYMHPSQDDWASLYYDMLASFILLTLESGEGLHLILPHRNRKNDLLKFSSYQPLARKMYGEDWKPYQLLCTWHSYKNHNKAISPDDFSPAQVPTSYRRSLVISSDSKIDSLSFGLRRSIKWNVIFWLNRLQQIKCNFPSTNMPLTKRIHLSTDPLYNT